MDPHPLIVDQHAIEVSTWRTNPAPRPKGLSTSKKSYLKQAGLCLVLILVIGAALDPSLQILRTGWPLSFAIIIPSLLFGFGRQFASAKDEQLLEDPEDELADLVAIEVVQDGIRTGIDSGMMSIVDDTIIFLGNTSSFALGIQHLKSHADRYQDQVYPLEPHEILFLRHPEIELWVRLTSLSSTLKKSSKLADEIETFLSSGRKPSESPGLYPPLTRSPLVPVPNLYRERQYLFILALVIFSFAWYVTGDLRITASFAIVVLAFIPFYKPSRYAIRERDFLKALPSPSPSEAAQVRETDRQSVKEVDDRT